MEGKSKKTFFRSKVTNVCKTRSRVTVKILKFGTPQTLAIIVLKIEKFDVRYIALMHLKDADGMANSVDPDQTASSEAV